MAGGSTLSGSRYSSSFGGAARAKAASRTEERRRAARQGRAVMAGGSEGSSGEGWDGGEGLRRVGKDSYPDGILSGSESLPTGPGVGCQREFLAVGGE